MKIDILITNDDGKKYSGSINLSPINSNLDKKDSPSTKIELKTHQIPENILKKIIKNLKAIKAPQLVVVSLKYYGSLTKTQQLEIFKKLGKGTTTFNGGNYTRDIIRKGLVHEVGKIGREPIYDLTEKGKEEANSVISNLGVNQNVNK